MKKFLVSFEISKYNEGRYQQVYDSLQKYILRSSNDEWHGTTSFHIFDSSQTFSELGMKISNIINSAHDTAILIELPDNARTMMIGKQTEKAKLSRLVSLQAPGGILGILSDYTFTYEEQPQTTLNALTQMLK